MARSAESVVHGSRGSISGPVTDPVQPRDLPAVDRLLREPALAALITEHGHTLIAEATRAVLDERRTAARAGRLSRAAVAPDALAAAVAEQVQARLTPRLRAVLNLTGTVIHTNLGRAPLAAAAMAQIAAVLRGPTNLEYDLANGGRGERDDLVEGLLRELTGAEAATVVNNNAAAVLLTLAALARRKEVIVSRGELIEIGGAFRLPDVMTSAGVKLVEVGTTNRTHPADYEHAIGPRTALLMKVHTSNYAVQGFTRAVEEAELARIARAHGLPLISDLGSGALIDLAAHGLPREPMPQDMLRVGVDVVTFSGDKLLGGPQAGLIVGRADLIARIRRHPLKRALRLSKLPLAALEATLRLYLRPERLARDLPALRLLTRSVAAIQATAQAVQAPLAQAIAPRYNVRVGAMQGQIGSGSLPIERLPSAGLVIESTASRGAGRALAALAAALRALPLPVLGRIAEGRLLLDCRCLEEPDALLAQLPALRARLEALERAS
jgi:L-seryl-tRNA(Ser) seleniumtransferase